MPQPKHNSKSKDQFVVAHVPQLDLARPLAACAAAMAAGLHKGMLLLYVCDPAFDNHTPAQAEEALKPLGLPYVVLSGNTAQVVEALPLRFGAVLMVTAVNPAAKRRSALHPRTLLRNYAMCKTAYMVMPLPLPAAPVLQRVAVSVDFRRESKEKLLWASYMARFMGSNIEVCHRDYADEGLRQKWQFNMQFLNKFFANLGLGFTTRVVAGRGAAVDRDLLAQHHPDLLISLTTDERERDLIDIITGPPELAVIQNPTATPVLLLNPRDDLYVLCD